MKQIKAKVLTNKEILPGSYLLQAEAPDIAAVSRPGQYVMVRCGEGHEFTLRRPLSVHRVSRDGSVDFLFAVVGRGTEWLAERSEGAWLDLFGPLGNGFEVYPSSRNLLLVAGGIGIAPLMALIYESISAGLSVTLLNGAKTKACLYPARLLPSGISTVTATEDGSSGYRGMITDLLADNISEADQVFACGPLAMYRRMAGMGGQLGDRPTQVLLEVVLGCGVGACLGCSIETGHGQKLVCKDGPVFELSEIIWEKMAAPPAGRRC